MARGQQVVVPRNRMVGKRGFQQHGPFALPVPVTVQGSRHVTAHVSPDDYERVANNKWRLDKSSGYAVRNMSAKERVGSGFKGHANTKLFMHVENFFHGYQQGGGKIPQGFSHPLSPYHMTGPSGGKLKKRFAVDHANNNRLDATRGNLRLLTWQENGMNKVNNTGYRGVNKARKGYKTVLQLNGKRISGGVHATKEHAALGYNKLLKKHKVKYGKPNSFAVTPSKKMHAEVNAAMQGRKKARKSGATKRVAKGTSTRRMQGRRPSKIGQLVTVRQTNVRSKQGKVSIRKRHMMRVGRKTHHGVGHLIKRGR